MIIYLDMDHSLKQQLKQFHITHYMMTTIMLTHYLPWCKKVSTNVQQAITINVKDGPTYVVIPRVNVIIEVKKSLMQISRHMYEVITGLYDKKTSSQSLILKHTKFKSEQNVISTSMSVYIRP